MTDKTATGKKNEISTFMLLALLTIVLVVTTTIVMADTGPMEVKTSAGDSAWTSTSDILTDEGMRLVPMKTA